MRVELVVLELDRGPQLAPRLRAGRRALLADLHVRPHLLGVGRAEQAERVEDRPELLDRLVRPQHDLPADRRALGVVGVQQRRRRLALQDERELPGQVVGVGDRRVGAQAVARRVPVAGVAHAEHPALDVALGVHLVVAPQRRRAQRDLDRVVAHQVVDDARGHLLVDLGRRLVDVVAPDDQPLVPRPHHAHEPHADAADVRARLHHPVEDARAVGDVLGQVGVEHDVHRPRPVHDALHRQADVLGDLRAPAVGADQVLGADLVALAAQAVVHGHGDAVGVLDVRHVLGVEAHAAAPPAPPRRG